MEKAHRHTGHACSTRWVILALAAWFLAGSLPVSAAPISRARRVADVLIRMRDRHPVAFDRRHPVLGRLLSAAEETRGTNLVMSSARSGHSARAESIHAAALASSATTLHGAGTSGGITAAQPRIALEQLDPSTIPTSGSLGPKYTRQILASSVVSTNFAPAPSQTPTVSPEAIPEPSTICLTLLLFGAAACWSRRRSRD